MELNANLLEFLLAGDSLVAEHAVNLLESVGEKREHLLDPLLRLTDLLLHFLLELGDGILERTECANE